MKIGIFAPSLGNGASLTGVNIYSLALVESLYKFDNKNKYLLLLSELNKEFYDHIQENYKWEKYIIKPILIEDFSIKKKIYRIKNVVFYQKNQMDYSKSGYLNMDLNKLKTTNFIHYTVFNSCSAIPLFIEHPYIVNLHDMRTFRKKFRKKIWEKGYLTHKFMQAIIDRVLRRARAIICETEEVKEDILRYIPKIKKDKIFVIMSPLPEDFLKNENTISFELLKSYFPNIREKYLVYPSVVSKDKNQLGLVKALTTVVKQIPDIQIILTGPDGGMLKEVLTLIKKYGLENNILYLGFISRELLKAMIRHSQGLLMPSFFESVSLPVFESMVFGKPVASSNICGMPYQLGEYGIYFNPYDMNEIAKAIEKLWNLENFDSVGIKKRFFALLDKGKYAEKIIEIYERVYNEF